jgi:hypothetical protein
MLTKQMFEGTVMPEDVYPGVVELKSTVGVAPSAEGMAKATTLSAEPSNKVRAPMGAARRVAPTNPVDLKWELFVFGPDMSLIA